MSVVPPRSPIGRSRLGGAARGPYERLRRYSRAYCYAYRTPHRSFFCWPPPFRSRNKASPPLRHAARVRDVQDATWFDGELQQQQIRRLCIAIYAALLIRSIIMLARMTGSRNASHCWLLFLDVFALAATYAAESPHARTRAPSGRILAASAASMRGRMARAKAHGQCK